MRALTTNELKELYNKAGEQWLTDKPWLNPANSKAIYEVVAEMVIAKMLEVNQQDAQDAARYRWLREEDNDELVLKQTETDCWYLPRLERLDAAIDAYTKDVQDENCQAKY